eukprot:scaffold11111_cov151-Skeletonema_dohrnii-CCMP3373.AAC.4
MSLLPYDLRWKRLSTGGDHSSSTEILLLCKRSCTCANCRGYVATVAAIFDIAPSTNASTAVNDDDGGDATFLMLALLAFDRCRCKDSSCTLYQGN